MIDLSAADICDITHGTSHGTDPTTTVTGPVVTDSRDVVSGALFVAIQGDRVDGHEYAAEAIAAGAQLVICERPLDGVPCIVVDSAAQALGQLAAEVLRRLRARTGTDVSPRMIVVAITGSVGKTTTKDLLAQVLSESGPTVWPVASFNNEIGLPLTVLRADASTRYLVLEMGANHLGELAYLTRIAPPDMSVVLAVGRAHVGEFGGIEAVARAKQELVEGLLPDGTAVLNADDLRVIAMTAAAPGPILTFGRGATADIRASDVRIDALGRPSFRLLERDDAAGAAVTLQISGEHHVHNALAVAAVAYRLGIPLGTIADRLSRATALSPHRMHVIERADGTTIIDDSYNANPDSMRAALKTLAVVSGRQRRSIAVLGEMLELGPDSRSQHDEVGRLAVRLNIRLVIVVGPGASGIFDGVTQEGSWGEEAVFVDTVEEARDLLDSQLHPGDVLLLKASHGAGLWKLGDELAAATTPGSAPIAGAASNEVAS